MRFRGFQGSRETVVGHLREKRGSVAEGEGGRELSAIIPFGAMVQIELHKGCVHLCNINDSGLEPRISEDVRFTGDETRSVRSGGS